MQINLEFIVFIDKELSPSGEYQDPWQKNQRCKCPSQALKDSQSFLSRLFSYTLQVTGARSDCDCGRHWKSSYLQDHVYCSNLIGQGTGSTDPPEPMTLEFYPPAYKVYLNKNVEKK